MTFCMCRIMLCEKIPNIGAATICPVRLTGMQFFDAIYLEG